MKMASETSGFQAFLRTPGALTAPSWQLETLADGRWPEHVEPTADTFEQMRRGLALAAPVADRVTG